MAFILPLVLLLPESMKIIVAAKLKHLGLEVSAHFFFFFFKFLYTKIIFFSQKFTEWLNKWDQVDL